MVRFNVTVLGKTEEDPGGRGRTSGLPTEGVKEEVMESNLFVNLVSKPDWLLISRSPVKFHKNQNFFDILVGSVSLPS